jgi:hypothetical protein
MTEFDEYPQPGAVGGGVAKAPGGMINQGVQISGGTVSGPVAAGYRAQATQLNQGTVNEDKLARLELLLQKLEAGASSLAGEQAEEVIDDVARVREEAHHRRPDWARVSSLVERITARVASFVPLLEVADHVRELVMALAG